MTLTADARHDPDADYRALVAAMMTGDETPDEAAIKEVCFRESYSSHTGRPGLWASAWLHSERSRIIGIFWEAGLQTWQGWERIEAELRPMAEATRLRPILTRHDDHRVRVDGDMAWTTFVETNSVLDETGDRRSMKMLEQRVLERVDGDWKIACMVFVPFRDQHHARAHAVVDGTGRVAHVSPPMNAVLRRSGLTVSAGRIRATRPKWDRELQATIARASALANFKTSAWAEFDHAVHGHMRGKEFPVLLGEDDAGGQRYCVVVVQDNVILVTIDDPARMERRLELANVVYGLSDGQLRIAREIVGGLSLPAAAERLGISPNTARTHLTRIFEKTGVGSQAALVRCLLTVGG